MDVTFVQGSGGPELLEKLIAATATVLAALIVSIAGGLIAGKYSRERDRQDRESQWRSHAIELTKLDLERKLKAVASGVKVDLRPSIQDFLANYRDLQELGALSPKDLYAKIAKERIARLDEKVEKPPAGGL